MKRKIVVYNNFIIIALFAIFCLVMAIMLVIKNKQMFPSTVTISEGRISNYKTNTDENITVKEFSVDVNDYNSEITSASENTSETENTENNMVNMDNIYYNDGFTMLCYVVSHEVGNCSYESKKAVAHTVLNRVNSNLFPDTVYDVLLVPGQYDAIWDSYYCGQFVPSEDTINACQEALYEYDFTLGATYYYNPNVCGYMDWFESLQICYIDDNGQRFFKEWE